MKLNCLFVFSIVACSSGNTGTTSGGSSSDVPESCGQYNFTVDASAAKMTPCVEFYGPATASMTNSTSNKNKCSRVGVECTCLVQSPSSCTMTRVYDVATCLGQIKSTCTVFKSNVTSDGGSE